jgi:hypothetical protein
MGVPPDPGRTPLPGHPSLGHLDRHHPAAGRTLPLSPEWADLGRVLRSQASGVLACDFFTVGRCC